MRNPVYSRTKNIPIVYKLTILIPTLSSRSNYLKPLLAELTYQIQNKPVQVIWLGDNKSISIGEKRNNLLSMAKGEFVSMIDDDDSISENYISVLLNAIDDNPEKTVICFRGTQNTDGHKDLDFRYDVRYGRNFKQVVGGQRFKCMIPDHLCCWNRSKITEKFPDKGLGEDKAWASDMAMSYTAEDQVILEDYLYHYEFSKETTETRR